MFAPTAEGIIMKVLKVIKIDNNNVLNKEKQPDNKKPCPKPPIKWAGGKSQLLSQFIPLFPERIEYYIEPFLGGGAVFFYLLPSKAVLIDSNEELVNFYKVVQGNLTDLLKDLEKHQNTRDYFYQIRAADVNKMTEVERASRFLYLNKTAYNGLYRVNRKGQFNVPFGNYKKPKIKDEENLKQVSKALQEAEILTGDFELVLKYAQKGAFIYLDPPYHPLSVTASFTSYTSNDFDVEDQKRLAEVFRILDQKGCLVMLSNSDTPLIKELYRGYNITKVYARRAINCKGNKRGVITELVIRNYG
jgi:DNA adenine methylase